MEHYNLPHNHGQNINRVLKKMPLTDRGILMKIIDAFWNVIY